MGAEGPVSPIGESLGLGKVNATELLHERPVAHLLAQAQEGRGHLCIEDGLGHDAERRMQDLEILGTGMEDLHDRVVREQVSKGG